MPDRGDRPHFGIRSPVRQVFFFFLGLIDFVCLFDTGVEHMIGNGSYSAAFPLHEGPWKSEHSLLTHGPLNDRHVSKCLP